MRSPIFFLSAALWALCFSGAARAADIRRSDHPLYGFILEGTIVARDYDKLRKLVDEDCPAKYYNSGCASAIYLASPGGSVAEAMKIGRLVRTLRWETKIPDDVPPDLRSKTVAALKLKDAEANYMCASACFFVYVAGFERASIVDKGILGIHRPYMSDADLKTLSANQALASATQVRTLVQTYLKEMGVPSKYADMMFSVPKDQVRWIDEIDFKADFSGIIPELKDWMDAKCNKDTDMEKRLWKIFDEKIARGETFSADEEVIRQTLGQKLKVRVKCEGNTMDKLREDAWKAFQASKKSPFPWPF
jgi:hypothetical protein